MEWDVQGQARWDGGALQQGDVGGTQHIALEHIPHASCCMIGIVWELAHGSIGALDSHAPTHARYGTMHWTSRMLSFTIRHHWHTLYNVSSQMEVRKQTGSMSHAVQIARTLLSCCSYF